MLNESYFTPMVQRPCQTSSGIMRPYKKSPHYLYGNLVKSVKTAVIEYVNKGFKRSYYYSYYKVNLMPALPVLAATLLVTYTKKK